MFTSLLLAPACAYAIIMAIGALQPDGLVFGRIDLAVLLLVLGYLCVGIIAVRSRGTKWVPAYLLVTYSTLLAIVFAEIGMRILLPPAPPEVPWRPMRRVFAAGQELPGIMPGISGTIEFTVNSLGLRGPEVDLSKVDLRILCVGGSTTECTYVTDKLSWPWALQDRLAEQLGKRVFVGNAGKSGTFSLHHEYLLTHYASAAQFDWVIVLLGGNDWGALIGRRTYEQRKKDLAVETLTPAYRNRASYRRLALVRILEAIVRRPSAPFVIQEPEGKWLERERTLRQEALKRNTMRTVPADLDYALTTYATNLRKIIAITRSRRQNLLLVTQPTLHRANLPEDLDRLLWSHSASAESAYTSEMIERMFNEFNQTTLRVSREEGVECLDLAGMLPKDTSVFYDDAHFNITGSQKVAAILADFLVPKLKQAAHAER